LQTSSFLLALLLSVGILSLTLPVHAQNPQIKITNMSYPSTALLNSPVTVWLTLDYFIGGTVQVWIADAKTNTSPVGSLTNCLTYWPFAGRTFCVFQGETNGSWSEGTQTIGFTFSMNSTGRHDFNVGVWMFAGNTPTAYASAKFTISVIEATSTASTTMSSQPTTQGYTSSSVSAYPESSITMTTVMEVPFYESYSGWVVAAVLAAAVAGLLVYIKFGKVRR